MFSEGHAYSNGNSLGECQTGIRATGEKMNTEPWYWKFASGIQQYAFD